MRGLPLTLGLGCLGLAISAAGFALIGPSQNVTTSTRVVFSFPGFEKGEYPDKSKFSPYDLRSPDIVTEALKRRGIEATDEIQSRVRSSLSVEGIIPDSIVKERDKLRAAGQTPRLYTPDEYTLSLTLPRRFPLQPEQRALFLNDIISLYQQKFIRTYVSLPLEIGKAFESLSGADYYDYDLVLNREGQNITDFLTQMAGAARAFRSPRTNLSFSDLLKQSQLFTQIRLNEVLGLIREQGLSKDRQMALIKMNYRLRILSDQEMRAVEEEKVVHDLLKQAQEREQKYALGIKSQSTQPKNEGVVIDQGLVDSLLVNDAYNFLVHQALEASLKTRSIQSEKAVLKERHERMESFINSNAAQRSDTIALFQKSLDDLKISYDNFISEIRQTYEDYQRQQFSDAIRVSKQASTDGFYRGLAVAGIAGLGIGGMLGLGLSLMGLGSKRATSA